jgi:hypothetical protein
MVEMCTGQVLKDRGDRLFIVIVGSEGGGAILGHMEFAVTTHTRNAGGTCCRDVPCMWYC